MDNFRMVHWISKNYSHALNKMITIIIIKVIIYEPQFSRIFFTLIIINFNISDGYKVTNKTYTRQNSLSWWVLNSWKKRTFYTKSTMKLQKSIIIIIKSVPLKIFIQCIWECFRLMQSWQHKVLNNDFKFYLKDLWIFSCFPTLHPPNSLTEIPDSCNYYCSNFIYLFIQLF